MGSLSPTGCSLAGLSRDPGYDPGGPFIHRHRPLPLSSRVGPVEMASIVRCGRGFPSYTTRLRSRIGAHLFLASSFRGAGRLACSEPSRQYPVAWLKRLPSSQQPVPSTGHPYPLIGSYSGEARKDPIPTAARHVLSRFLGTWPAGYRDGLLSIPRPWESQPTAGGGRPPRIMPAGRRIICGRVRDTRFGGADRPHWRRSCGARSCPQ